MTVTDHHEVEHQDAPVGVLENEPVLTIGTAAALVAGLLAAPELVGMPDVLRITLVVFAVVFAAVLQRTKVSPA